MYNLIKSSLFLIYSKTVKVKTPKKLYIRLHITFFTILLKKQGKQKEFYYLLNFSIFI